LGAIFERRGREGFAKGAKEDKGKYKKENEAEKILKQECFGF
jgi:hypothetical protein